MKNLINISLTLNFLIIVSCENFSSIEKLNLDPHIIFTSRRWWNYDLFITNIYGDQITHLTKNEWLDFNPAISASGNKLAFVSNRDGNREIYIMDLIWRDGYKQWEAQNLINITNSVENDWTPNFSPVTDKIVFSTYFPSNDNYDIFTMNSDGSGKKNITNTSFYEKNPQFSPDGSFILYQGWKRGKMEIFFVNLLENNNINISKNSSSNDIISQGNAISPDGQKVVFTSDRDNNKNIYIMNIDGSNLKQLTFDIADDYEPIFSYDGLSIIFTSNRDGNKEVYLMTNEGLEIENISNNSADDWNPRIFPDSKKIIFQSLRDGPSNWEIYIMNIDGSSQKNLTNNPSTDYSYVILPLKPII
tara:strand:- start:438 stop:1517 length:1080 start_codon:yes stop_codon:yes gene_type:complete